MGRGPVLLSGASGLLGHWLLDSLSRRECVVALTHRRAVAGVVCVAADLREPTGVAAALAKVDPTLVVHAAYAKDCESIVDATRHVVNAANAVGAHVLFISTDAVNGAATRWFTDEMRRPTFASDAAAVIWRIATLPDGERCGCWHLAGAELLSRLEIARRMVDRLHLPDAIVESAVHPGDCDRPRVPVLALHQQSPPVQLRSTQAQGRGVHLDPPVLLFSRCVPSASVPPRYVDSEKITRILERQEWHMSDVQNRPALDGEYEVTDEHRRHFAGHGFVHLAGLLSDDEIDEIAVDYDRFLRREIAVEGKDFCDMAGDYGRDPADFSIVNVMLPRRYHPAWVDNIVEQRSASVARQLCGNGMELDYDQLLAKQPYKQDAVFAWHQDMAYWPDTPDTRTATVWLAIDDSTIENGCMRFVPETTHESALRPHAPMFGERGTSHALGTDLRIDDVVVPVPIKRGDCTVHNEWVMHGSGGNNTAGFRRAYILAFRSADTISVERSLGFTHSHNDGPAVLDEVGVDGQTRLS